MRGCKGFAGCKDIAVEMDAALGHASGAAGEGDQRGIVAGGADRRQRVKPGGAGLERPFAVVAVILDNRFDEMGLVRRLPGRTDRRVKELDLTPTGARLRTELMARMTSPPASLGRLSPRDQRTLVRLLTRLLDE